MMDNFEWYERTKKLLIFLSDKNRIEYKDKVELYLLHNERITPHKRPSGCSGCVVKVYEALKKCFADTTDPNL